MHWDVLETVPLLSDKEPDQNHWITQTREACAANRAPG